MTSRHARPRTVTGKVVPVEERRGARWVVAFIVVALLVGSLLPAVGGVELHTLAAPLVAFLAVLALLGPRQSPRRTAITALVIVGVLAYEAYVGPDPLNTYGFEKRQRILTSTLVSALAAVAIWNLARLRTFAKVWVLAATVLAVGVVVSGEVFSAGRASVFDNNPIWVGRALATGALCALALPRLGASRRWRLLFVVLAIGLLLTGSRGPAMGLAAGLVVLLVSSIPRMVGILLAAASTYLAFSYVPVLAATRIGQTLAGSDAQGGRVRSELWASAWRIWREHPGGAGIGNWGPYSGFKAYSWPHNLWLEVGAELGTIPALIVILAVAGPAVMLLRRRGHGPQYVLVLALLVAECVAVSLSGDLSARTFFFMIFLSMHVLMWADVSAEPPAEHPPAESGASSGARPGRPARR